MPHLKTSYPYLFSLALRTNPFDPEASAVISKAGETRCLRCCVNTTPDAKGGHLGPPLRQVAV